MRFLTVISAIGGANAAFIVTDQTSVLAAAAKVVDNLMAYYTPNEDGVIPPVESESASGFQWFEMGMFWGAMMEYTSASKDQRYLNVIGGALGNASFGEVASFIGPRINGNWPTRGRWNDDLGWYGLPAIQGAEILGADARMPNGVTYLRLATNTFEQMFSQWDAECGGGIYWMRDRNDERPNRRLYKGTISNVQGIVLGIRLYLVTNDGKFLQNAIDMYNWLKSSGLVTSTGAVYDGEYATQCWQIETRQHSYNAGLFLSSAGWLYRATGDAKYLEDARNVLSNFQSVFTNQDIIIDQCEVSNDCKENQPQFKGVAIRGLLHLFNNCNDTSIKVTIQKLITASAIAMNSTCNTAYSCSNFWLPGTSNRPLNVHNQINAVELLNAVITVTDPTNQNSGSNAIGVSKTSNDSEVDGDSQTFSNSTNNRTTGSSDAKSDSQSKSSSNAKMISRSSEIFLLFLVMFLK